MRDWTRFAEIPSAQMTPQMAQLLNQYQTGQSTPATRWRDQSTQFFTPPAVGGPVQRNAQGIPVGQPAAQQAGFRGRNIMQPAGQNVTNIAGFANSAHRKVAQMKAARGGSAFGNSLEGSGSRPARRGSAFSSRSLTKRDEFGNKLSDLKDMDPMERAQLLESHNRSRFAQTKEDRDAEAASLQNIRTLQQISESPARERREETDVESRRRNRTEQTISAQERTAIQRQRLEEQTGQYEWQREEAKKKREEGKTKEATRLDEKNEKERAAATKEYREHFQDKDTVTGRRVEIADIMGHGAAAEETKEFRKAEVQAHKIERGLTRIGRTEGFDRASDVYNAYVYLMNLGKKKLEYTQEDKALAEEISHYGLPDPIALGFTPETFGPQQP